MVPISLSLLFSSPLSPPYLPPHLETSVFLSSPLFLFHIIVVFLVRHLSQEIASPPPLVSRITPSHSTPLSAPRRSEGTMKGQKSSLPPYIKFYLKTFWQHLRGPRIDFPCSLTLLLKTFIIFCLSLSLSLSLSLCL